MRGPRPTLPGIAALVLAAGIGFVRAAGDPPPAAERPMSDEDVVQLVVSGAAPAEIIERIRSRPVRFDLSEEMLRELRIAGVAESVLKAMAERQAQMEPVPGPDSPSDAAQPSEVPEAELSVRLISTLPVKEGERAALWFPDRVDEPLARALGLAPQDAEARAIGDLAVFLACLTSEHVPDQWRTQTPLGRDFGSVPRHELLAFAAGAQRVEAGDVPAAARSRFPAPARGEPARGWLRLEVPEALHARLAAQEPHRILLGVAILAGDRYLMVASALRDAVSAGPAGTALTARLIQGKATRERVALSFDDPQP